MAKNKKEETKKYQIEPGQAALLLNIEDDGSLQAILLESKLTDDPEKSAFIVDTLRTLLYLLFEHPDVINDAYMEMTEGEFIEENEKIVPFEEASADHDPDNPLPKWAKNMKGSA